MVKLSELIAPCFYEVHENIKKDDYVHYWLKGGRGSTKSSFISVEIILGIMKNKNTNAVVLRKVRDNLKDSVYEQLLWAIEKLCVYHLWQCKLSPLELIYIPTGQKILFRGADKPRKLKSTKVSKGHIKYIWYEEVDEFNGMEEIRTINQSLLRGGNDFNVFYSYNPPKNQRNWVNNEVIEKREDRLVHHSTYLSVAKEWLGEQFYIEAEHLKKTKPQNYEHEYLGEVVGTGAEVFTNLRIEKISDEEISTFDHIKRGMDFGFAKDPYHYSVCHFDKTRRTLYIFYEVHKVGASNRQIFDDVKKENINNKIITADSAEPRTISELVQMGLRILPAKKGPDSVNYGIKFLCDLDEIVIDPIRCPNTKREFYNYALEEDNLGGFKSSYPDYDNHSIDSIRYALEDDMRRKKVKSYSKGRLGI